MFLDAELLDTDLRHERSDRLPAFTLNYLELLEYHNQKSNPFSITQHAGFHPNSKRGVFSRVGGAGFLNRRKQ